MYRVEFHNDIKEIGEPAWQSLAQGAGPFLQYHFLHALEISGSVGPGTGWLPSHIAVYAAHNQALIAVMPAYLKSHSYGEYVFDWAWAEAWQLQGLRYYPKLVAAIPFTPSVSSRLLSAVRVGEDLLQSIKLAVVQRCREQGLSSWHILFPTPAESLHWQTQGLIRRSGTQFHWFNRNYQGFDDFLATMSARKRKNLRKERASVSAQGIKLDWWQGRDITEGLWDAFYNFYQRTYALRGQQGYLRRDFFSLLNQEMGDQVLLLTASAGASRPIAAALYLRDEVALYGRYWGCEREVSNLHFEACYYQGIEYCIDEGLQRFDAGAQGEHKVKRGFEPMPTWSCHWLAEPRLRPAVARYCAEEQEHVQHYMKELASLLPYHRS